MGNYCCDCCMEEFEDGQSIILYRGGQFCSEDCAMEEAIQEFQYRIYQGEDEEE